MNLHCDGGRWAVLAGVALLVLGPPLAVSAKDKSGAGQGKDRPADTPGQTQAPLYVPVEVPRSVLVPVPVPQYVPVPQASPFFPSAGGKRPKGNNGVGNGIDPQPPGNPPVNDGPGTAPGRPGNRGGKGR